MESRRDRLAFTLLLSKENAIKKNQVAYDYNIKLIKPAYVGDNEVPKIDSDVIIGRKRIITVKGYINGELSAIVTTTFIIV